MTVQQQRNFPSVKTRHSDLRVCLQLTASTQMLPGTGHGLLPVSKSVFQITETPKRSKSTKLTGGGCRNINPVVAWSLSVCKYQTSGCGETPSHELSGRY